MSLAPAGRRREQAVGYRVVLVVSDSVRVAVPIGVSTRVVERDRVVSVDSAFPASMFTLVDELGAGGFTMVVEELAGGEGCGGACTIVVEEVLGGVASRTTVSFSFCTTVGSFTTVVEEVVAGRSQPARAAPAIASAGIRIRFIEISFLKRTLMGHRRARQDSASCPGARCFRRANRPTCSRLPAIAARAAGSLNRRSSSAASVPRSLCRWRHPLPSSVAGEDGRDSSSSANRRSTGRHLSISLSISTASLALRSSPLAPWGVKAPGYRDRMHLFGGAVYGLSPGASPAARFPHATPVQGLFQAGQTTYPGYGVGPATMSGIFAAEALMKTTRE